VILLAGRDAAGREHQIMIDSSGSNRSRQRFRFIAKNPEIGDLGAKSRDRRGEQVTI